jgi:hypothetical protein
VNVVGSRSLFAVDLSKSRFSLVSRCASSFDLATAQFGFPSQVPPKAAPQVFLPAQSFLVRT